MKRKRKHDGVPPPATTYETPEINYAPWCVKPHNGVPRGLIVVVVLLYALIALTIAAVAMQPERSKQLSQEQRTARLVVEGLRDELGTKAQSLNRMGHEGHACASSKNAQPDTFVDGRSEEHRLRLDRLESLITQVSERLVAVENASCKCGTTVRDRQLEQVNRRLDRLEWPWPWLVGPMLILAATVVLAALLFLAHPYRRMRKAEERSQLVEAVAERLAANFAAHSSPLTSGKTSMSEDDEDASFENVGLSAVEMS